LESAKTQEARILSFWFCFFLFFVQVIKFYILIVLSFAVIYRLSAAVAQAVVRLSVADRKRFPRDCMTAVTHTLLTLLLRTLQLALRYEHDTVIRRM